MEECNSTRRDERVYVYLKNNLLIIFDKESSSNNFPYLLRNTLYICRWQSNPTKCEERINEKEIVSTQNLSFWRREIYREIEFVEGKSLDKLQIDKSRFTIRNTERVNFITRQM